MIILFTEKHVELPDELREMYAIYQQEIVASIYSPRASSSHRELYQSKLPPIYPRGEK